MIRGFAKAFTMTDGGREAWIARLQPLATEEVMRSLRTVNVANVRQGQYIEHEVIEDDETQLAARILYSEGLSVVVYLINIGVDWKVYRYDRFDD